MVASAVVGSMGTIGRPAAVGRVDAAGEQSRISADRRNRVYQFAALV
jgi:hypothetical protein